MRNKNSIILLTIVMTLLSVYFISFSFIAQKEQNKAIAFATDKDGKVDASKKQSYLDSIYNEPVYNFLGMKEYTYKEVKESELALGLDLQGGMHVVLEVSPIEILKALAGGKNTDPQFIQAIRQANEAQKNSQEDYTNLFYAAYKSIAGPDNLKNIFANSSNKDKISFSSTDAEVEKVINKEVEDAVDRAYEILKARIDKFGVIQPNIQKIQGTSRIQVELPGVENPQRVRNLLQGTAQLEFLEVYHLEEIGNTLTEINKYLLSVEKNNKKADSTTKSTNNVDLSPNLNPDSKIDTATANNTTETKEDSTVADTTESQSSSFFSLLKSYNPLMYDVKDTGKINKILAQPKVRALLPPDLYFLWNKKAQKGKQAGEFIELTAVKRERGGKAALTGDVITDARADISQDGKGYEISMMMNAFGANKWKKITADAAATTPKRRIAIVLDNVVYSAPTVQNEIPNGSSQITGDFTQEEAFDLANVLKAGKLPAPVRIVEEVLVGPTLGKESINAGLLSMLAGLSLVVVIMILYYSRGGFVADLALLFNILFILGILASFNSVLTLPGIAGIVLTIGMAVDANVLIFERIKEELGNGRSLLNAINIGYDKAFSSIFDSNVTTILTGIILFLLGSGPVKGFATTLMIGIACSFFTAVFISKIIVLWATKGKDEKTVTFTTFISRGLFKTLNYDFIGKRKIAYVVSSVIIIAGFVSIFLQGGLNLGVDFKGGRSYIVNFKNDVSACEMKANLADDFKGAGTEVKTFGSPKKLKITTSYLIDDETSEGDAKVEDALQKGLTDFRGADSFEVVSSSKVGATVADDIKNKSWKAIIVSLLGIFIYVLIRFRRWQFSLGGVVALLHDTLMVISFFALARWVGISYEVDQVFVAAILTIVGFSINDTVIVFDRVREFRREFAKMTLPNVLNNAINSTLSRTIMTTVTVLIVVIILYAFGGETLKGFSFALLVGVICGSYSTIFIAIPMVLDVRSKKEIEEEAKVK